MLLNNNIIKTKPATKIIVAVSFISIMALAAYNWAISPQITYLQAAKQYKVIIEGAGAKSTIIRQNVEGKLIELDKLQQEVSVLENSFFTSEKAREFFSDIEPVAVQYDCTIESSDFMPSESRSSMDISNVTLNRVRIILSGSYKNIMKFLDKIKDYPQRVVLSDILIERTDNVNGDLSCQINIAVYVIEDKEKITNE